MSSDGHDIEAPADKAQPTSPSKKDLDSILQSMLGDEDKPMQMPDEYSTANSDMSSLLPFGNVIPSDCEQSISTGPLDEKDMEDLDDEGLCPNEVYIQPAASSTPYGSYFNRRRTIIDGSVSSNESNSLSSILDSIGWTKKRKIHHSRGIKKQHQKGFLFSYLSSHSDFPHHERQSSRRSLEEKRMARTRATALVCLLCTILVLLTKWAALEEEEEMKSRLNHPAQSEMRQEGYSAGMSQHFANMGVPKIDERPNHAQNYYDALPKDSKGRIIKPTVPLPDQLSFVSPLFGPTNKDEIPLFWIVPKSGGGSIRAALSTCYELTIAGAFGVRDDSAGNKLKIIDNGNFKYVNVETFTPSGLARAKELNLVGSKMAHVIATPLFLESLKLFDDSHHARAFTLLRHPIERAASMFEKLKKENPELSKDMTLENFARSKYVENNYLVRYLSGSIEGDINTEHLAIAKAVLQKFLIGFSDDMGEAMFRIEKYFGFKGGSKCRDHLTKTRIGKPRVKPGTEAWGLLQHQNALDLELYSYAQELFTRQGIELF